MEVLERGGLGSNYALFGDTKRTSVGRKLSGLDFQGMAKEPKTNPISINVCQAHLPKHVSNRNQVSEKAKELSRFKLITKLCGAGDSEMLLS